MKILVALSGGIDSSVAACLLKEQGHTLIGVRFALWSDPLAPAMAQLLPSKCCNAQTASRTIAVANMLGIPLHVVSMEEVFKQGVVDPFLDAYRRGLTPNPCIGCNRTVKFNALMRLADEWECDKIATGHYARTTDTLAEDGTICTSLLEAVDANKDQSYYLHGLSQAQLQRTLFPLGTLSKQYVFELARRFGIPFDEHYQESQDLCFFPERDPKPFLIRHIPDALCPGPIVRTDGTVVGMHAGLPLYTIGQRRGLGIGGLSIPLEVVSKRVESNELIVDDRALHTTTRVSVRELHWISWVPQEHVVTPFECRTRSHSPRYLGSLKRDGEHGMFTFDAPISLQTPGQSLVLYRGEEVMGGGVME